MRPYFAIIQDSFREALASRTLQVLLTLITLLLVALAVPGLRIDQPSDLTVSDVIDPDGLAALLGNANAARLSPAQLRIREQLPESLRNQFLEYRRATSTAKRDSAVAALVTEFNTRLANGDLYEAEAWREVSLTAEGRQLIAEPVDKLSPEARRRRNRLVLDSAFDGYVQDVAAIKPYLTYVVGEVDLPVPPEAAHSLVQSIVYILLKWFVGAAGMLAAVIFTASIIPQMFEPGAIDLLLSKPISRSGAFLAKFFGGCAFILFNAGLFVCGLWLILGLRHGEWNGRVMLAIPVFLLAFAIYFSISAYVGVRWRNPILAIALTLVAWIATFSLHQIWYWGQRVGLDGLRAEVVLATENGPFVTRKNGEVLRWDNGEWKTIFTEANADPTLAIQRNTGLLYPLVGPVLAGSGEHARLTAIERRIIPPIHFSLGDIVSGDAAGGWSRQRGPTAPGNTIALFASRSGDVLLVTRAGVQRFVPPPGDEMDSTGTLEALGPEKANWQEPVHAAIDPTNDDVAIWTRGRIVLLQRGPDGHYSQQREHVTDKPASALIGLGREQVVLGRPDGRIERFDRGTLEPRSGALKLPAAPQKIATSADGTTFVLLDHERRLHQLNGDRLELADVRGQRNITAAGYTADGRLLIADRFPRVTAYAADGAVVGTWEHNTGFATAFLWVINPLRVVLPKPDELDLLVREAVGANDEGDPSGGGDLSREREYVDLWTPVWTSALFVVVVLAITCWSIERRDF